MSDNAAARLETIKASIISSCKKYRVRRIEQPAIIAVTKTVHAEHIRPLLKNGHRAFGENRVQEALAKWRVLKQEYPDSELHLIGPLQTNKAKEAVALFDVIQILDRPKLAAALAEEMKKQGRSLPCFIQVNTGEEPQKSGVPPFEADVFIKTCRDELGLNIVGLMCIPPADEEPSPHFALLKTIAERNRLSQLSMGMSGDYEIAACMGATHLRIGTAIFGERRAPA